jgi:D-xylose transport system permease protein
MSSAQASRLPQSSVRAPFVSRAAALLAGDWRYVPIATAIVLIWAFFAVQNPVYLSPRNLSNLCLQSVVTGMLALGLVPVLLIGQIDMSVAAMSAVAATIAGQLLLVEHVSVWLAIGAGVLFGGCVGFL